MVSIAEQLRCWALGLLWRTSTKPDDPEERTEALCRLLRRYPRWRDGHRILAEECLEKDDVARAYTAARCYQTIVGSDKLKRAHSNLLLGRCYLRRGEWQSALSVLKSALEDASLSAPILEELAAAHMLGGNYVEALDALQQIQEKQLSAQAKAALAFAKSKAGV
jgi:tetratricopeptide (TPR) repeat protein